MQPEVKDLSKEEKHELKKQFEGIRTAMKAEGWDTGNYEEMAQTAFTGMVMFSTDKEKQMSFLKAFIEDTLNISPNPMKPYTILYNGAMLAARAAAFMKGISREDLC
jgi:hypothetical protein